MPTFRIKEAATLLGVSADTLRRWADGGRIETVTDASGRLAVDGAELARLAQELAVKATNVSVDIPQSRSPSPADLRQAVSRGQGAARRSRRIGVRCR